jgi:hypothetical protein
MMMMLWYFMSEAIDGYEFMLSNCRRFFVSWQTTTRMGGSDFRCKVRPGDNRTQPFAESAQIFACSSCCFLALDHSRSENVSAFFKGVTHRSRHFTCTSFCIGDRDGCASLARCVALLISLCKVDDRGCVREA